MLNCHVKCDEVLKIAGAPVCKNLSKASNSNRPDYMNHSGIFSSIFDRYSSIEHKKLQGTITFVLYVLDRFKLGNSLNLHPTAFSNPCVKTLKMQVYVRIAC